MARTITLSAMRSAIRTEADVRSTRWTDAKLNGMINRSIAELYDLIVTANHDHYLSSDTISVVSGTESYTLSTEISDFYKAHGVDVLESGGDSTKMSDWVRLEPFIWEDRGYYEDNTDREAARYRFMGDKLYLVPCPNWSGTVKVWYVAAPAELSADGDTFDGISGWEQYVIVDVCIKIAAADETDAKIFMAEKQKLIERIHGMAQERDRSNPDRVRNVRRWSRARARPWDSLPRP